MPLPESTSGSDREPRRAARARVRFVLLAAIALLYGISVPWYREGGSAPELWLGLPDWVSFAVLCYVCVAVLNAIAWSLTDIEDPEPQSGRGDADAP